MLLGIRIGPHITRIGKEPGSCLVDWFWHCMYELNLVFNWKFNYFIPANDKYLDFLRALKNCCINQMQNVTTPYFVVDFKAIKFYV